jgi:hypothetical protein
VNLDHTTIYTGILVYHRSTNVVRPIFTKTFTYPIMNPIRSPIHTGSGPDQPNRQHIRCPHRDSISRRSNSHRRDSSRENRHRHADSTPEFRSSVSHRVPTGTLSNVSTERDISILAPSRAASSNTYRHIHAREAQGSRSVTFGDIDSVVSTGVGEIPAGASFGIVESAYLRETLRRLSTAISEINTTISNTTTDTMARFWNTFD